MIPEGSPADFPPEREWLATGLVAAGADLSSRRLVQAYSQGIFPWYHEGTPILWWSPNPRCVLFTDELHIARSLARTLRRGAFSFSINRAFIEVIRSCAAMRRPGQRGTWLTSSMIAAYLGLHRQGLAHSVECWLNGELVGGVYGVALGRIFFGESMFHTRPDASKAALVTLIRCMREQDFLLLDCQQTTPHMLRLGAREIPRRHFLNLMREHAQLSPDGKRPTFRNVLPNAEEVRSPVSPAAA
ncbi:MAG: leucyl/phenylalanyl-tRNA--protein transferase [Desulfovibrionaceae bacterium]|nr:leucyl/phenylalanyl-tRNA--protein transferase [Desulfovibrionaceae bacterium]